MFLFVGEDATLFCALYVEDCKKLYDEETIEKILEPTRELLNQKLAQIPNNIKIVIEYTEDFRLWEYKEIPQETLKLKLHRERKLSLATALELLTKRGRTLDLLSVFREVKRTLHIKMAPLLIAFSLICGKSTLYVTYMKICLFFQDFRTRTSKRLRTAMKYRQQRGSRSSCSEESHSGAYA